MYTYIHIYRQTLIVIVCNMADDILATLNFCAPHRPLGGSEKPQLRFSQPHF